MENLKVEMKFNKNGITLIALVITIIVLLILAGVAIATLTGDNGVLTKASSSKLKNEQATVKERIILAYGEYQIEVKTSNNVKLASTEPVKARSNSQTFLQYLESKEYINSDRIVNVKNLTGNKMTLGNGTGKSDVYIISLNEEENKYVLNYYDANENETFLWETNADRSLSIKYLVKSVRSQMPYSEDYERMIVLTTSDGELSTYSQAYAVINGARVDISSYIQKDEEKGFSYLRGEDICCAVR